MLKDILKKNTALRRFIKKRRSKKKFMSDFIRFTEEYTELDTHIKPTRHLSNIDCKMLLIVHSLEKGMSNQKMRPFGQTKCIDLIKYIDEYKNQNTIDNYSTPFKMSVNILREWIRVFEKNDWKSDKTYQQVVQFINQGNFCDFDDVQVGITAVNHKKNEGYKSFLELVNSRHSTREYLDDRINEADIDYAIEAAIKAPSACNRQMSKVYYIQNEESIEEVKQRLVGLRNFGEGYINIFVLTFDVAMLSFDGERNQGYFNSGLFAMNLVNAFHEIGIGSCLLQWANDYKDEDEIKKIIEIPPQEKIAVVMAAGYYTPMSISPKSNRLKINEVLRKR